MEDAGKLENKVHFIFNYELQIVDFEHIEKEKESFKGYDYMFSCFGTTRKDAGGAVQSIIMSNPQAPFMHIDHDYNCNAAAVAKEMGINHYGLLSAMNANAKSFFTYPKCKGLIEQDIQNLQFDTLSIFRPGLLHRGEMARWNEKMVLWCMPSIQVAAVAKAMRIQAGIIVVIC